MSPNVNGKHIMTAPEETEGKSGKAHLASPGRYTLHNPHFVTFLKHFLVKFKYS